MHNRRQCRPTSPSPRPRPSSLSSAHCLPTHCHIVSKSYTFSLITDRDFPHCLSRRGLQNSCQSGRLRRQTGRLLDAESLRDRYCQRDSTDLVWRGRLHGREASAQYHNSRRHRSRTRVHPRNSTDEPHKPSPGRLRVHHRRSRHYPSDANQVPGHTAGRVDRTFAEIRAWQTGCQEYRCGVPLPATNRRCWLQASDGSRVTSSSTQILSPIRTESWETKSFRVNRVIEMSEMREKTAIH